MAGKIRGITIQLDGDTTGLSKSLQDVNKEIKNTQGQLKDVEKLLKLDPKNTELLRQKQELLTKAIKESGDKLETLKKAEETMKSQGVDQNSEQFMALQREIAETQSNLKSLQAQADKMDLDNAPKEAEPEYSKLEKAAQKTTEAMDKLKNASDKVAESAKNVANKTKGLSIAGGAVASGLLATGANAIKTADDLETMSARTGLSTEMLQKFAYASDMVDVSTEELASAMSKMKKQIGENPAAFEALGVAVTNTDGTFRDIESVFYDSLAALSQIGGETERDLAAMDLFGKSADTLATIIDDGGESLQAYGAKAEEMGLILSEDTIGKLTSTGDTIDEMKARTMSTLVEVGAELLENLAPAIEFIVEKIGEVIAWLGTLDSDTLNTILIVAGVIAAISPLASLIGGISTAIGALSSAISFLVANPIVLLIAAIVGLVTLIATKGDQIQAILQKVDNFLKNIFVKDWSQQFGVLGDLLNGFFKIVGDVWDGIKKVFDGIIDFIRGVFTGDWSRAWDGVKKIFSGVFEGLVAIAKAPLNAIIGVINGLISGVNLIIDGLNKISIRIPDWVPVLGGKNFGFNLSHLGKIAYLAQGGILQAGQAIVGERGPELLSMSSQGAIVQPLTNNTTNHNIGGITLNVYGAAGQDIHELADIIMDEIGDATRRQEAAFA